MKKILLLTTGLGEDAHASAQHVQEAVLALSPTEIRLEILDLFDTCYGRFTDLLRYTYQTAVHRTPKLLGGFYQLLDSPVLVENHLNSLHQLHLSLEDSLLGDEPDCVVSFSPIYNLLLQQIYAEGRQKKFALISIVTEATPHPLWQRVPSDLYLVANSAQAEALAKLGLAPEKIRVTGLPVSLAYTQQSPAITPPDLRLGRPHVLYLMPDAKKKAVKLLHALAEQEDWDVTVSVGRDGDCAGLAHKAAKKSEDRMRVIGWTRHLSRLLLGHNLVIGRPDETLLPELIAARCPLIAFPVEEGDSYAPLRQAHAGVVAAKTKHAMEWLERAFLDYGRLCSVWRKNLESLGATDGAWQIAQVILEQTEAMSMVPLPARNIETNQITRPFHVPHQTRKELLLCDFHTHTTWSDGQLSVRELVDFYGQRRFDCLCVTDHLCDPKRLLGKLVNLTGLVIPPSEIDDYFCEIEREKKRAWDKYSLLLWTGVEFNKDGYTAKSSTHLLGIDLKKPIDPSLHLKDIITEIHAQGALAIASHPHKLQSAWGKETLFLWENQKEYTPLIDAWEVANRDDIFNPVSLKKLPFLANSDLHKPKHIYSWKTLLHCEKDSEAIKQCIRVNRDVSLTLYRDDSHLNRQAASESQRKSTPPLEVLEYSKRVG